jgi:hypothetical protein
MSSVLHLALKHLDELSHGTPPRDCLMGHLPRSETNETNGTRETAGTRETRDHTHRCTVCGQAARFGYGVRLLHGQEGRWFCAAHRPELGNA